LNPLKDISEAEMLAEIERRRALAKTKLDRAEKTRKDFFYEYLKPLQDGSSTSYLKDAGLAFAVALTGWEPLTEAGDNYFGGNVVPVSSTKRIILHRMSDGHKTDLDVGLCYDYTDTDDRYVRHGHHLIFGILFGRILHLEHVPEMNWE
jgi:hypothetical protein